ncbi:MAG TPA: antitoxin family protein [Humisphaera sp.]|nr:antitoxin family protein [Humisphaera sp.]
MVRHVDAIFSHGAFRPLEPLALPEGTRVHLSVQEETNTGPVRSAAKIHTPRLAHPEDAGDFEMKADRADAEISQWAQEMDASTAQIPAEEHDRFLKALDEIERESKEAVRKQWGLP